MHYFQISSNTITHWKSHRSWKLCFKVRVYILQTGETAMTHEVLGFLDQTIKKEFDSNRRVLSFEEFLHLIAEKPGLQLRGSAKYMLDMMDSGGKVTIKSHDPSESQNTPTVRYKLFDPPAESSARKVVGLESAQNQIYRALTTFHRQGFNNKLLLLHGPNGSAKTSLIHALMAGLERYSHEPEGALYSFNWVFPLERVVKGGIGINSNSRQTDGLQSYAKLEEEEVLTRISCEMKDHPFLLIPVSQRKSFLEKLIGKKGTDEFWNSLPHALRQGDLCHRCKQIFDALLIAKGGDLRKVLMNIQVERFYFSRLYRKGLVTIEPQLHVDAAYQQLTMNRNISSLPPALQNLNLFSLNGDLVDGNRGMIEYSDLLKRPIDSFKYLLITCENGTFNVGPTITQLDAVMLGSANDYQLDAFKEFPDFQSFKARIELIRVPYLLSTTDEEQIYAPEIAQVSAEKHVAPHSAWALALWATLTRLKKPNSINYPPSISPLVANLTPLDKAKLYDSGEMPLSLTPENRKLLRATLRKIRDEFSNVPYYEGRIGASAREIKSILFSASQNPEFSCLSPLAIFRELEEFIKHVSEYEFLKQDIKDGYHDTTDFINIVRNEYLTRIDREVRDSIGLYNVNQWEDFLKKYIQHISMALKKEKIKNPITGKLEDPDHSLMSEFEKIVEAPREEGELGSFRQNILSQVGAWSLDHQGEGMTYSKVFPEFWHKLEKHYYESQKSLLTKMHNAVLLYDKKDGQLKEANLSEEGSRLAKQTVENMKAKLGYCEHCAKEVITFLMRHRY